MNGRFAKVDEALVPTDDGAKAILRQMHNNMDYEFEMLFDHDAAHRRWMFGTISNIAKVLWLTPDQFRAQLLFLTDFYKVMAVVDGKPLIALRSMSRASMSGREIRQFWDKAQRVIRDRIMPTLDEPERLQVEGYLDPRMEG